MNGAVCFINGTRLFLQDKERFLHGLVIRLLTLCQLFILMGSASPGRCEVFRLMIFFLPTLT